MPPIPLRSDVPIALVIPEDLPVTYGNYTYVQYVGLDVIISVFQAVQRIDVEQEKVANVPARCVARIAMNITHARELLNNLNDIVTSVEALIAAATAETPK